MLKMKLPNLNILNPKVINKTNMKLNLFHHSQLIVTIKIISKVQG